MADDKNFPIILGAIIIAMAIIVTSSNFQIGAQHITGFSPNASLNVSITNEPLLDWTTECSLNRVSGTNCLVLSSHNPDVDNSGSREDIWEGDGRMTYLTTAQTLNITSTSSDDAIGGIGLTTLFVRCLDENFVTIEEIILMNGTNTVQTTMECFRPAFIAGVFGGSSEENLGDITATSSVTGDLQMQMDSLEGLSKNSQFTVPANQTATIKAVYFGATKVGGQAPIVEVKGKARFPGTSIWIQTFDFKIDTSVGYEFILIQPIGNELVEGTDYRLETTSTVDNTDVLARTYVVFQDN